MMDSFHDAKFSKNRINSEAHAGRSSEAISMSVNLKSGWRFYSHLTAYFRTTSRFAPLLRGLFLFVWSLSFFFGAIRPFAVYNIMAPPTLSKQALGEVTNSSSSNCPNVVLQHRASCLDKTAASSRPPRARRASFIPSLKSFSKSSSAKLKKAYESTTVEAGISGPAVVASTLVTVVQKHETIVESSTSQKPTTVEEPLLLVQEENLHLKVEKFNLLKELLYAYSQFVAMGYRCTDLEAENKQLRQDQECLRRELCLALEASKQQQRPNDDT
jgi:hypothetical protein